MIKGEQLLILPSVGIISTMVRMKLKIEQLHKKIVPSLPPSCATSYIKVMVLRKVNTIPPHLIKLFGQSLGSDN